MIVLEQGKWVNNVIGLLNHREFVLMLIGRQPSSTNVTQVPPMLRALAADWLVASFRADPMSYALEGAAVNEGTTPLFHPVKFFRRRDRRC